MSTTSRPTPTRSWSSSGSQSPQWGEHRARYWLDAARYADTNGIHFDNYREIWSYRDWVIDAFNQNMPFDRFTIEQLAGDLLPNATDEQRIATGFNRCNITTNEGGAIDEEYLVLYTRDRTETTSRVWMGLTANCAVCHDHKFDPLPQKEFYSLSAFFNNTTQAAMDGNVKDTPPVMFVAATPEDRKRWKTMEGQIAEMQEADQRSQAGGPGRFREVARGAGQAVAGRVPGKGCGFTPAERRPGPQVGSRSTQAPHVAWRPTRPGARRSGRQGFHDQAKPAGNRRGGRPRQPAGVFLRGWIKLPGKVGGAVMARMDDGNAYRGWDLCCRTTAPGPFDQPLARQRHQGRLEDADQARKWHHVMVTYDGSRAAGARIYINGKPQPVECKRQPQRHDADQGALKIASANGSRINGVALQDLRIYGRSFPMRGRSLARQPAWRRSWEAGRQAEQGRERRAVRFLARREDKPIRIGDQLADEKEQTAIRAAAPWPT